MQKGLVGSWKRERAIRRAMRLARIEGYDPYNSAQAYAKYYWE
jgi:hypothetical protein